MTAVRRRPLLAGLAGAAAAPRIGSAQGNEVRLGALYPFSGSLALLGDESFRGLEMAVEERNANGGVLNRQVRLAKGDAVDQNQAIAEARRLIGAERVTAVLGTYASPLAFAATQVAELQGVPYFEMGAISDPITERGFRYVFRTCPRASDFGAATVGGLVDALAPAFAVDPASLRIAILHEEALYGQTVAAFQEAHLRARGLNLVEKIAYAARSVDLSSVVQRLRGVSADIVLHTGYQNDIVLFFRGMQEAGWKPRMVIGSGAGYSLTDTARAVGPAFEGVMNVDFTQFAVNEDYAPGAAAFVEAYKRRYGSEPRSGHSLANYFGARVCLDAVQRAGAADKDRIRNAMMAADVAEGTTPTGWGVRFDEKGQNTRAKPFLLQWQGGRQVTVFPAQAAVAQLRPQLGA
ncbi:ABC transporter substrate-binding protein [Neoroseomonas oryzicola]|uniref:ABC transporter substrate-binding protein n=1 Tax=Neoroseomonas oryzicola TaxID=535904 RepID=A0A9X9WGU0_9PROT|nr:ABC transporter substrate-binding protein [Neoroseomonas oryzicola]MBR0659550.1 ABC transporter substrate-binding protein [Neoroseomonas oryzicola]NKE16171.1 ABC transporter substrate-binding protein [Neoroseomonas oryzicola]